MTRWWEKVIALGRRGEGKGWRLNLLFNPHFTAQHGGTLLIYVTNLFTFISMSVAAVHQQEGGGGVAVLLLEPTAFSPPPHHLPFPKSDAFYFCFFLFFKVDTLGWKCSARITAPGWPCSSAPSSSSSSSHTSTTSSCLWLAAWGKHLRFIPLWLALSLHLHFQWLSSLPLLVGVRAEVNHLPSLKENFFITSLYIEKMFPFKKIYFFAQCTLSALLSGCHLILLLLAEVGCVSL